ncbi:MAG: hypothetical protein ABI400_02945 [Lacisediminihabitans sp.]
MAERVVFELGTRAAAEQVRRMMRHAAKQVPSTGVKATGSNVGRVLDCHFPGSLS